MNIYIIYIYIVIHIYIYMHTYMIHAYSICSHPGVDIRWIISKFITRMGISLKIPYSIYFRMIIYIYTYRYLLPILLHIYIDIIYRYILYLYYL